MNTLYPCSDSVSITGVSDAWHHKALGKSAETVWKILLVNGECTPKQLAKFSGRGESTVRRVLDKLFIYGLSMPSGAGYWIAEPVDHDYLKEIASLYGTLGAGEMRKVRHNKERAVRANYLIRIQKENWFRQHEQENVIIDGCCSICTRNEK